MKIQIFALIIGFAAVTVPAALSAQNLPSGVIELTPADIRWMPRGQSAGQEQAELINGQDKVGPYVVRHKFPAGFRVLPHTHPDTKMYTIIAGTWCIGYGEKFDESKLKCLPAGSFYTEPANTPHFVEVREAVIIQVMGTGPSGTTFVNKDERN